MLKKNHKYFLNYPLYLNEVNVENSQVELIIFNDDQKYIKNLVIQFDKENVSFDVNTSNQRISINHKVPKYHIDQPIRLVSCTLEGNLELFTKDYTEITITQPKSINQLGYERFLFRSEVSKLTGQKVEDIKYIGQNYKDYWTCTCGHLNKSSVDACSLCHTDKKQIFKFDKDLNEMNKQTTNEVHQLKYTSIFLGFILMFQWLFQGFFGDFLFDNEIKNAFFGVLNRFILPVSFVIILISLIFAKLYYKKIMHFVLDTLKHGLILYFNALALFLFIATAYNLMFILALDLIILFNFIRYRNFDRYGKIFPIVKTSFLTIAIVLISIFWQVYSKYTLTVESDGVNLVVETQAINYEIPNKINGLNVTSVTFNRYDDYAIENLTINESLHDIYIYSSAVLDNLDTVKVNDANPFFYIENNILYRNNGDIELVPIVIETLTVNNQIVESGVFKDLYNLKTLTIGSNVEIIKAEAFANAIKLEEIIFEDNSQLKTIGELAFSGAESLTSIDFPISVQTMGIGVLEGASSIEYVRTPFLGSQRETEDRLSDSSDVLVYLFGDSIYSHSSYIPSTLKIVEVYDITRIHNVTFYQATSLEQIILPNEMIYIGIRSFYQTTSLISFTIPSGVSIIPTYAFQESGIKTLIIPASVTAIEANAFKDTNLESVTYLGDINQLQIDPLGNQDIIDLLNQ